MDPDTAWAMVLENKDTISFWSERTWKSMWFAPHAQGLSRHDVYQQMLLVAYKSAQRWDPDRGATFRTYLYNRLRGERMDMAHPYRKTYKVEPRLRSLSLDAVMEVAELTGENIADTSDEFAQLPFDELHAWSELDNMICQLTGREREIVERRAAGESMQQVGDALGVTESRISQILKGIHSRFPDIFRTV